MSQIDQRATAITRKRYQRISGFYDLMEYFPEKRFLPWRERIWSLTKGSRILEVGVGTGKNMPFYPPGMQIAGIDLTPGMLEHARRRAAKLNLDVDLRLGDAQSLDFEDNTFDSVVSTFVFCSVPDPILGMRELDRVTKPGGKIIMLEHVRSEKPVLGTLMEIVNPLVVRLMGANINRRTVQNARDAGLEIIHVEEMGMGDIFKLIVAQPEIKD